jgi:type I restriction enzyme S subunit
MSLKHFFLCSDNLHYVDECPRGWAVTQMKSVIDLLSGRDLENSRCNAEGYGVPYLVGASCIDNGHINIYRWIETPEVISKEGDILLSCKGTVGEVVLNTLGNLHIARQFMAIRSKAPQCILPDYLGIVLKASIETLKKAARGIIPGISREDILELTVMIPPIDEQQRILSRIVELNHSISQIVANTCD